MPSTFDPGLFLQTSVDSALSTTYVNVPEGEYTAVIGELSENSFREIQTKDGPRVVLDIPWMIDDPKVQEVTHRKENKVRQSLFLDVTLDSNGKIVGLDLGKGANVQLGRLREELGQNQDGRPWGFNMLQGCAAMVEVTHSIDGEKVYANVTAVRRI